MTLDETTGIIVETAFQIHSDLGPGLLESVYETVLCSELEQKGLLVDRQIRVPIEYKGMVFEEGFRLDVLVNRLVIVEVKAVEITLPVHLKQVLTYLKFMNLRVGFLINFGAPTLKEGIKRVVNKLQPEASPYLDVNKVP